MSMTDTRKTSAPVPRERALFEAALDRPLAERAEFLRTACGDDGKLRARVAELLAAEEEAGGFMGGAADSPGVSSGCEASVELAGRYRLLEQVGEGGFGQVYLADQTAPVRRRVAVKLLKAGMDSRRVVARFEVERQALALMDHPNIARVFDAGTTADGRPFFVMEWVPGAPVTRFCDEAKLPVGERLALFLGLCDALHHAHQKGIIHRDLKPSNVLVTRVDGRPVPKVIDFGVAKAIEPDLVDSEAGTRAFEILGTPAYMSPEQARWSAHEVDIRTDIYSLGVLLHELLVGRTPMDPKVLQDQGWEEWRRQLSEADPIRLTERWRALSSTEQASAAEARGTTGAVLARMLKGDLEWIVFRCLERDPERRYESAAALAYDIHRHLSDEPVAAAAPSRAYRAGKFLRRHRLAVGAATLVALSLLGGTVVSLELARRARAAERTAQSLLDVEMQRRQELERLRQLASDEAARARTEAATARAVTRFLNEDVLALADPSREAERELSLRTVLDRASRQLSLSLTNEPAVAAAIHETLGRAYQSLALPASAAPHFESAWNLYSKTRGAESEDSLRAAIEFAFTRIRTSEVTNALALAEATTATARERLGRAHPLALHCGLRLAWFHFRLSRTADWHRVAEETYQDAQGAREIEDADLLGLMHLVARKRGRSAGGIFESGEQILLQAIQLMHERRGTHHSLALRAKANLAAYYYDHWRRVGRAETLFREVYEGQRRVLGENHEWTITTLGNLGLLYLRAGHVTSAQRVYLRLFLTQPEDPGPARWLPELLAKAPLPSALASSAVLDWRYVSDPPPELWTSPDFNEADWLPAPEPRAQPGWWRAYFELSEAPLEPLVLLISGVDEAEVYLNGVAMGPELRAAKLGPVRLRVSSPEATRALRAGRNVVAVRILAGRDGEPFRLSLHRFPPLEPARPLPD